MRTKHDYSNGCISDMRMGFNPMSGYVSDSTLERRRYKQVCGAAGVPVRLRRHKRNLRLQNGGNPGDSGMMRNSSFGPYQRAPDGSRLKRVLLTKMGKDRLTNGSIVLLQ